MLENLVCVPVTLLFYDVTIGSCVCCIKDVCMIIVLCLKVVFLLGLR